MGIDMSNLSVWHRLENATQEYGPTFTTLGSSTHVAGRFEKGLSTADSDSTDGITTSGYTTSYPSDNFAIEYWWKPDHASTTAQNTYHFGCASAGNNDYIYVTTNFAGAGNVFMGIVSGGAWKCNYYWGVTWSANTWYHFLWTLDSSLGAQAKIDLFVDGVDQGTPTINAGRDSAWSIASTMNFDIGKSAHQRSLEGCHGVMDNFKIWSNTKRLANDRFYEGFNYANKRRAG